MNQEINVNINTFMKNTVFRGINLNIIWFIWLGFTFSEAYYRLLMQLTLCMVWFSLKTTENVSKIGLKRKVVHTSIFIQHKCGFPKIVLNFVKRDFRPVLLNDSLLSYNNKIFVMANEQYIILEEGFYDWI